jgi:polyisoprenoid-binding protein YceI
MRITYSCLFALVVAAAGASAAQTQTWTVDSKSSLAWWQLSPHLGHLWATTCPQDPAWHPGESRGAGYQIADSEVVDIPIIQVEDPRVPIFPRKKVAPICSEAVTGTIAFSDAAQFTGARGVVTIRMDQFVNGMPMRDAYARKAVYSSDRYPDVRFYIDSLINVQRGDTIRATAVGAILLRGVRTQLQVPVEALRESGGLRVRGKFSIPAPELVSVYGVSKFALGLSLGTHIWKTLHLGFDVVLKPRDEGRSEE